MNHHPRTVPSGTRPGLLARLRGRLAGRRSEAGDVMVEVIIFMGVISLVAGAYSTSSASANSVARAATAIDVVDQQAQGVLEQAQVQPWETLGFNFGDQGYKDGSPLAAFEGKPIVSHSEEISQESTESIQPYVNLPLTRGVEMEQTTYITWTNNPAGTPAGAYGTKQVTVVIEYHAPGTSGTKTKRFSTMRSSTPSEAVPTSVSSIDDARAQDSNDTLDGACPRVFMQVEGSVETLRWDSVPNASAFHVASSMGGSGRAALPKDAPRALPGTTTSLVLDAESSVAYPWAQYSYEVEPVIGGVRINCAMTGPLEYAPDPPACPNAEFASDNKTLNWQSVEGAAEYVIERRINSDIATVQTNPASQTSYAAPAAPASPAYYFRVLARSTAGTSQDCTWVWQPPTAATALPSCATGVEVKQISGQFRRITWSVNPASDQVVSYQVVEQGDAYGRRTVAETSDSLVVLSRTVQYAGRAKYVVTPRNAVGSAINCPEHGVS